MATYIPRPTPLPVGRLVKGAYSAREVFEALAYELNKVSAPFEDVDTFNHFHNLARDNYYKKRYNLYDTGQQTSDDMADLSGTFLFTATSNPALSVATEQMPYPPQYYHMLSMTVFFRATANFRIYKTNDTFSYPAERIAADRLAMIRQDHYNRPQLKKPYFLVRPSYVELHTGLHSQAALYQVEATYLLLPEEVTLLLTDLDDLTVDPSQVLREKPVVTREVLKELTKLVLEYQANPRLQSFIPVNEAVPSQPPAPAGQAPAPARGR